MTDIIQPISAAGIGTVVLRPLPDVQPFSIRSGYSYEGILSDIRTWIRDTLVPYLEDSSAQTIFQQNVDTMIDTVNKALTDQSGIVTAALNAAVQEIVTAAIPVTDAAVTAVLQQLTSNLQTQLDKRYVVHAPAPSGGDDTSVLQPLLDAIAASDGKGELILQDGHYHASLVATCGVWSPIIRGRGRGFTAIHGVDATKPVVQYTGAASGNVAGGGLKSLRLEPAPSGGGVAIENVGVDGVQHHDVAITSMTGLLFDEGVRNSNKVDGKWSEFNTFQGAISKTKQPIRYFHVDGADESFHGSGVFDTTIGLEESSTSAVLIDAGSVVYNAPFEATVFNSFANMAVFDNRSTRESSFFGHIGFEFFNGVSMVMAIGNSLFLLGEIELTAGAGSTMGKLWLAERINRDGTQMRVNYKPFQLKAALSNIPVGLGGPPNLDGGEVFQVVANVQSTTGYRWAGSFKVYQIPGQGGGVIGAVEQYEYVDQGAAWGAPIFAWVNSVLYVTAPTNGAFPADSSVTAVASLTQIGQSYSDHHVPQ